MKKIYLFLTALLLATALPAATSSNSSTLISPDGDETPENTYKLTVNLKPTNTDNLILIYGYDELSVEDYAEIGDPNSIIENHGSISFDERLLDEVEGIYVGVFDKATQTTLEYKEVVMNSDQTVDFDLTNGRYNLTVNLNATNTDDLILIYGTSRYLIEDPDAYFEYGDIKIIENHSSVSFSLSKGQTIYVGVYDKLSKKTLEYKEVIIESDQTVDFNIKNDKCKLTVNLNATKTDDLILIYGADEFYVRNYGYWYQDSIIENHGSILLREGQTIYVGIYDNVSQKTIEYREVVMDSDKTIDFKLNLVTLNISAPAEIQDGIKVYAENKDGTFYKQINGNTLVHDGEYEICIRIPNNYNYLYKTLDVSEDTSLDIKVNKLAITCQDIDGNVASDIALQLRSNKNDGYSSYRTDENGLVISYWCEGDTVRITPKDNNFDVSNYIVIMSEDKNVTLRVPNKITFKLYVDGRPYTNYAHIFNFDNQRMNYDDDDKGNYTLRYDSKHPLRLYMDDLHGSSTYCDEGFVAGYFIPTDGCKVEVASVSVQSDGKGLVFPRNDFQPQQIYRMFVGNVVRLAAVPVGDGEFVNWEINGKQYTQPLIDYTVTDDAVTAIAHFSGDVTTNVKGVTPPSSEQITVSIEGSFLRLPESVEGDASFYSVDGRMVKQVGVVGDRIVISDLPAGAYVLTLYVEGRILSARFVKP